MRATLLLCDYAQVADNKLMVIGGGWDSCPTPTPPHGVAVLLAVPWLQTNLTHAYRLELLDEDSRPVLQPGPSGEVAIEASGAFEVGRPPGVPHGIALSVPIAVNVGPLMLEQARGYLWRLTVDEQSHEDWAVRFRTR
jgi:hypothetical protein